MKENISWLGHSSVKIRAGKQVVYIDPWKLKKGAEKADIILISHSHYDHFSPGDVNKIRKEGTVILASADVAPELDGARALRPGDRVAVGETEIEAVPSYNLNKAFHPREKGWLGFLLTVGRKRIYYGGDTDLIPEMNDLKADVVILPVGGTYTMTAEEAAQAADRIGPEVAIPVHCGDLVGTMDDARKFRKLCRVPVDIKPVER